MGGNTTRKGGHSRVKNTSSTIPEPVAKPAQKQGTKQKSDVQPVEMDGNKSTAAPSKKAKTTEEATKSTSAHIAPRPISKGGKLTAAPSLEATGISKGPKKRSSPMDDTTVHEDPKTPVPPLKKARVNEKKEMNAKLNGRSQPIRRSGMSC